MCLKEESCCPSLRNVDFDDLLPLVANQSKGVASPPGLAGALVLQIPLLVGPCSQGAR